MQTATQATTVAANFPPLETEAQAPARPPNAATLANGEKRGGPSLPQSAEVVAMHRQGAPPDFVPLDREARPSVHTAAAAHYLNRRPQTLRGWACHDDGPIRPRRVNGRLAWATADLRELLGVA